jgi:Uma2 family endonuclease
MTTRPSAKTELPEGFVRLPEPPKLEDMNNYLYFNRLGNPLHLARHLGYEGTTLVASEAYISPEPTGSQLGLMAPDLFIAFNIDLNAYDARNGYVISEQGKPPDFVLEIGSESTGRRDSTIKREGYERLGVLEYWRFDHSGGRFHGAPLAGDRLVEGTYQPIPIERIDEDTLQGYSAILNLYLRWERGELGWYDPETGQHILTYDDQRERAETERAGRIAAEARVRELEAELERHRQS